MRDINLQSGVYALRDFPMETSRVMFLYDERGWSIRCYDRDGNKITTMTPTYLTGEKDTVGTLVPDNKHYKFTREIKLEEVETN